MRDRIVEFLAPRYSTSVTPRRTQVFVPESVLPQGDALFRSFHFRVAHLFQIRYVSLGKGLSFSLGSDSQSNTSCLLRS